MYCMRHEVHVGVGTVSKEGPAGAGHECGSRNCRRMSEINRGRTGATILPAERKARRDPAYPRQQAFLRGSTGRKGRSMYTLHALLWQKPVHMVLKLRYY
ncbi:unnamed protein product [Ectocarpus sp. 8 AP-2014]